MKAMAKDSLCPLVCILLLNWNGEKHLKYALPSVLATDYPNYELVVIDNASTDGSVEYLKGNFLQVTLLHNQRNLQWAGGNNVGVRYAIQRGAKYVALLNNDVKVDPRWLSGAVQTAEQCPSVGCVGFRIFTGHEDKDGRQFEAAEKDWYRLVVTETDHISGCALVIATDVFERIGFFDEVYVAYADEVDFEKRAMRAGYQMVQTNIPIWHHSMGSWTSMSLKASLLTIRNTLRCAIKNDSPRTIGRRIRMLVNVACNPFYKRSTDMDPIHFGRLRPANIGLNSLFLVYALVWNLISLPQTLFMRRAANLRITHRTDQF